MSTKTPRTMREQMPICFAWIEDLRQAFGADEINALIKAGLAGVPVFHARENGHEVGTPYQERGTEISAAQMVIRRPAQ